MGLQYTPPPGGSGSGIPSPSAEGQIYIATGPGAASWSTYIAEPSGGTDNVALGSGVLDSLTSGASNVGLGLNALTDVTTGGWNIGIGDSALKACTISYDNVAIGSNALETLVGDFGAGSNVAIGSYAMQETTYGFNNVAVGMYALWKNTNGTVNVAIGSGAAKNNTDGAKNVAIGGGSLDGNLTGDHNVAVGFNALYLSDADENIGIGREVLPDLTSGVNNIAIGSYAGGSIVSGSNNVIIGGATSLSPTLEDHVVIATGAGVIRVWISELGDVTLYGDLSLYNPTAGGGSVNRRYHNALGVATAAGTFDIQVNVPIGARIIGCQLRVDTALTSSDGGTTWSAAYIDGSTQAIATGLAFAQLTKKDTMYDSFAASDIVATQADIRVTCDGGKTFISGGEVRAVVWYEDFSLMSDII